MLKSYGDRMQPWRTTWPCNSEPFGVAILCSYCCFLVLVERLDELNYMCWKAHLAHNLPYAFMLYAVKSFGKINKARERSCWNMSLVLLTSLSFHDNKRQLIDIISICANVQDDWVLRNRQKHKQAFTVKMRLMLKWFQTVMSCQGKVCPQHSYEEAGNIKVQQAIWIYANEKMYVRVLVDDTDVYYFCIIIYMTDL